ncbi:MAG TPA: hypothetical protein VMV29_21505, partial [Ktedonobacterales bacterium]|nr:hypothetical protein [Ktedonobacterales bacterium]
EVGVVGLAFAGYFVLATFPQAPLAVIILPPLVIVALLLLWRNRRVESRATLLEQPVMQGRMRWPNAYALLLTPLIASGVYALAQASQINTPIVGYLIYAITIPLGFLLFGYAAVRILWRRKPLVEYAQGTGMPIAMPAERSVAP